MGGGLSLPSPSNYMCADGDVGLHGLLMLVDVLPSSSGRRLFKISDELKVRNGTKSDFMALSFSISKIVIRLSSRDESLVSTIHGAGKTRKYKRPIVRHNHQSTRVYRSYPLSFDHCFWIFILKSYFDR
jgi:hypothetical protein